MSDKAAASISKQKFTASFQLPRQTSLIGDNLRNLWIALQKHKSEHLPRCSRAIIRDRNELICQTNSIENLGL
jgi:hypothetical protein